MIVALSAAASDGLKLAEIVQLAPAATLLPQLLDTAKSAALEPLVVIPEIDSAAVPVFDNVTVCAALVCPMVTFPNATDVALSFRR